MTHSSSQGLKMQAAEDKTRIKTVKFKFDKLQLIDSDQEFNRRRCMREEDCIRNHQFVSAGTDPP